MSTFKYAFECCGVYPTLALKLPQLRVPVETSLGTPARESSHFLGEFTADLSLSMRADDVDEITQIVSPQPFGRKEVLFDIDSFGGKAQLSPIHGKIEFQDEESKSGVNVAQAVAQRTAYLVKDLEAH